jgi:RNA polymerase sigma-70 factor (ECF subfamily)
VIVHEPVGDLVEAAAAGDREAFRALVERNWERLVRLARSVAGDVEAEDAVQEALLAAWRGLPRLRDRSLFDAWVTRIVFRRSLRCTRRARWRARTLTRFMAGIPDPRPDETTGDLAIQQLLSGLTARQRAVLHLTVVEGMTDSEIATTIGIRASSVRAHRRRARERIRRMTGTLSGTADARAGAPAR